MTTLANRPNPALLVIDVQNGLVTDALNRDIVVANMASLVDKARAQGAAVELTRWGAPTPEAIVFTNLCWRLLSASGRQAQTLATSEVTFR